MPYDMLVRDTGAEILLEGIAYPGLRNGYPTPVTLFGEGPEGKTWTSPFLTAKLVSANNTISTPAGTFYNVRRYDIAFGVGVQTWYLAPGVGFVQFGAEWPFVLSRLSIPPAQYSQSLPGSASSTFSSGMACPNIGIEANPPANGDFSTAGKKAAFVRSIGAGANFQTISASWQQLEPSPGRYDLSSIADQILWSKTFGTDVAMTIKTIDTMSRALPYDLQQTAWNDALLLQRWQGLVRAVTGAFNGKLKWLNLGNEVDIYLSSHPNELSAYYTFLQYGQQAAASSPGTSTGVVFAFDTYHLNDAVFRTLAPVLRHVSFTYYAGDPLAPGGIGQRDPTSIPFDIADMISAAAEKPLILTEVGFSSASAVGSTPALQQTFYSGAFAAFAAAAGKVAAASFSFMSDIPATTASGMSRLYSASSLWAPWFQNLGLFDAQGMPKPAWTVFQTQATRFRSGKVCSVN